MCRKRILLASGLMVVAGLVSAGAAASEQGPVEAVRSALAELDHWLGSGSNARAWHRYLRTDVLRAQLDRGDEADIEQLRRVLDRYETGANGLELPKMVAMRRALARWIEALQEADANRLPLLLDKAREDAGPLDPERLPKARKRLQERLQAFERYVAAAGPQREKGWKAYLLWDQLNAEVQAGGRADLQVLERVAGRLRGDAPGLELPLLVALREELWNFMYAVRHGQAAKEFPKRYAQQLDLLQKQLTAYEKQPTPERASAIGMIAGWLQTAGRAQRLVDALHRRYGHSNLFVRVSAPLLASAIERDVDTTEDVTDVILGTNVYGTARTRGRVELALVPDQQQAVLEIRLRGTTTSDNVGYQRSVRVFSTATTQVYAAKRLLVDADGVHGLPAEAHCSTDTHIHGISAPLLIRGFAWRQAMASQSEAERIGSRHAEERIEGRMDRQAEELIKEANEAFESRFRVPALRRRALPEKIRLYSTEQWLGVEMRKANLMQIAAPSLPPPMPEGHDIAVAVHQSFLINMAEAAVGGDTLSNEQMARFFKEVTGQVPAELQLGPDEEPWAVTLAPVRPLTVHFTGGQLSVLVRGTRFRRGDQVINRAMDLGATYKVEQSAAGPVLVRQGDVQASYVRGGRESIQQLTIKTFMRKKFEGLFKERIEAEGIPLPPRWQHLGKLYARQMICQNGWLVAGWSRGSDQTASASRPAAGSKP